MGLHPSEAIGLLGSSHDIFLQEKKMQKITPSKRALDAIFWGVLGDGRTGAPHPRGVWPPARRPFPRSEPRKSVSGPESDSARNGAR